jgi:hypothetical protein
MLGQTTHGPGIDIDGAGTVALQFQGTQVLLIESIKTFLFAGDHG